MEKVHDKLHGYIARYVFWVAIMIQYILAECTMHKCYKRARLVLQKEFQDHQGFMLHVLARAGRVSKR